MRGVGEKMVGPGGGGAGARCGRRRNEFNHVNRDCRLVISMMVQVMVVGWEPLEPIAEKEIYNQLLRCVALS